MEQFGNVGQFQTDFHKQSLFTSDPRLSVSLLNLLPKLIQFYEEGMHGAHLDPRVNPTDSSEPDSRLGHWHGHIYTYLELAGFVFVFVFVFFYQLEVSRCLLFYFSLSPSTPSQSISRFSQLFCQNLLPLH